MKKFILPFFLLVSFLSSSQHLYKDLWNVMSFSEAKSELNEYFSYKYSKIKIVDSETLFYIGSDSRNLSQEPFSDFDSLLFGGGLFYVDAKPSSLFEGAQLVGVQLETKINFDNFYSEVDKLKSFFENILPRSESRRGEVVNENGISPDFISVEGVGNYQLESVLGIYDRKELIYNKYEDNTILHFKLNTISRVGNLPQYNSHKNVLIRYQFTQNWEMNLQILIYDESDATFFKKLLGAPESTESGF
jgi:hypothetical protein